MQRTALETEKTGYQLPPCLAYTDLCYPFSYQWAHLINRPMCDSDEGVMWEQHSKVINQSQEGRTRPTGRGWWRCKLSMWQTLGTWQNISLNMLNETRMNKTGFRTAGEDYVPGQGNWRELKRAISTVLDRGSTDPLSTVLSIWDAESVSFFCFSKSKVSGVKRKEKVMKSL